MPATLDVWLGREPAGTLSTGRRSSQIRFDRVAGGASLTIANEGEQATWPAAFARSWFDNLLPEEGRRTTAESERGVAPGDTFGLLAAIGWECAGAVSVLPDGVTPGSGSYLSLSDAEVWERLDALPRMFDETDRQARMSLGGAQDKLLLATFDDAWFLPLDGALSTHILKPEADRFEGLAMAETWALRAAAEVTQTARATLMNVAGHRPTTVVERYDRTRSPNGVERSHQEDLCQLLGLPPAGKYARSDGPREPSLRRLADILVARAHDPSAELVRLLEQVVVTIALGNADAHAKDLSVLHAAAGTAVLAPCYDIVPTLAFLPNTRRAALSVGRKWRIDEVGRRHLADEARSWGVPDAVARAVIEASLGGLRAGMAAADAQVPELPAPIREVARSAFERLAASEI